METKTCTKCKVEQSIDSFYIRRSRNNQPKSICKKCESILGAKPIEYVPDLEGEIWMDIEEFKGFYVVSNKARVKRIMHRTHPTSKLMKTTRNKQDYHQLVLTKNGIQYCRRLNRLVAIAFLPNPENKPEVNHLKGKDDNTPESLVWATTLENIQHAWETGLSTPQKGSSNGKSVLTEKDVLEIRASTLTPNEISKSYNVNVQTIYKILSRTRWKHI